MLRYLVWLTMFVVAGLRRCCLRCRRRDGGRRLCSGDVVATVGDEDFFFDAGQELYLSSVPGDG